MLAKIAHPWSYLSRLVAVIRLYAVARAGTLHLHPKFVKTGLYDDGVIVSFNPDGADEMSVILPPLAAIAAGQQLVRYGTQAIERLTPSFERFAMELAHKDSIMIERDCGATLDS